MNRSYARRAFGPYAREIYIHLRSPVHLVVLNDHLATAKRHPAGTTDRLLQADRERPVEVVAVELDAQLCALVECRQTYAVGRVLLGESDAELIVDALANYDVWWSSALLGGELRAQAMEGAPTRRTTKMLRRRRARR